MIADSARAARANIGRITAFSVPRPRGWAYDVPGSRDLRIDLLRGFLVLAMVVDHLGGNSLLNGITGNNQFLISAAEGFVFISGLLVGIVYGKRLVRQGPGSMLRALVRRTLFLYVTVTALTLGFVALFFTNFPIWFDRGYGLGVANPLAAVEGALRLHYTYNGTDILQVYVLLIGAAPLAFGLLWLGRKIGGPIRRAVGQRIAGLIDGPLPLLVVSWSLYILYQTMSDRQHLSWPFDNSLSFPLLPWQALFFTGLALGYHRESLGWLKRWIRSLPAMLIVGLVVLVLVGISRAHLNGTLSNYHLPWMPWLSLDLATYQALFDKTSLAPGRVIAFVPVALFATQLVTLLWKPIRTLFGWLLLPLGQSALFVYSLHLVLLGPAIAYLGFALYSDPPSPLASTLAQSLVLVGIFLVLRLRGPLADLGQIPLRSLGQTFASFNRATRALALIRVPVGSEHRRR